MAKIAGYQPEVCDWGVRLYCRCSHGPFPQWGKAYSRRPWRSLERCVALAVRHALRCRARADRREAEERAAREVADAYAEIDQDVARG